MMIACVQCRPSLISHNGVIIIIRMAYHASDDTLGSIPNAKCGHHTGAPHMELIRLLAARLGVLDALQHCGTGSMAWSHSRTSKRLARLRNHCISLISKKQSCSAPRSLAMAKRSKSSMTISPSGGSAYIDSTGYAPGLPSFGVCAASLLPLPVGTGVACCALSHDMAPGRLCTSGCAARHLGSPFTQPSWLDSFKSSYDTSDHSQR